MTVLNQQEKQWILDRRITRLTDGKEVQIYPMGAERYLSSALFDSKHTGYDVRAQIVGKKVLVIPGFGNSGFLFAQAGAQQVTVVDKDPVTMAWIKAFKKYYHYKESSYPSIGELLTALSCWYPPLLTLPFGRFLHALFWLIQPNALRRIYIHYMLQLAQQALQREKQEAFELNKQMQFHVGEIHSLPNDVYDTAFVPYLLGVRNGVETEEEVVDFMNQLFKRVPQGCILVNPSSGRKEFYFTGKRYFETIPYASIQAIPKLQPYFVLEDKHWFRTQGLAVFSLGQSQG